jgi:hypothetical protein
MLQDMRPHAQIGDVWREVPLRAADNGAECVLRIDGLHVCRCWLDALVRCFTQLPPNYMHLRFSDSMLASPSSTSRGDVFERRDNHYVDVKSSVAAHDVSRLCGSRCRLTNACERRTPLVIAGQ